eukprot:4840275-Pleurochrysis_carterae.AAC.2
MHVRRFTSSVNPNNSERATREQAWAWTFRLGYKSKRVACQHGSMSRGVESKSGVKQSMARTSRARSRASTTRQACTKTPTPTNANAHFFAHIMPRTRAHVHGYARACAHTNARTSDQACKRPSTRARATTHARTRARDHARNMHPRTRN